LPTGLIRKNRNNGREMCPLTPFIVAGPKANNLLPSPGLPLRHQYDKPQLVTPNRSIY
jgi:hypothetical protein